MGVIKQFYLVRILKASLYFIISAKHTRVTKSNSPATHLENESFPIADVHIFLDWQNIHVCLSSICSRTPHPQITSITLKLKKIILVLERI